MFSLNQMHDNRYMSSLKVEGRFITICNHQKPLPQSFSQSANNYSPPLILQVILLSISLCLVTQQNLSKSFITAPFLVHLMLLSSGETGGRRSALGFAASRSSFGSRTSAVGQRGSLMKFSGQKKASYTIIGRPVGVLKSSSVPFSEKILTKKARTPSTYRAGRRDAPTGRLSANKVQ